MGIHKVILQFSNRDYGALNDAYFSVKLPSNLKGECWLYMDDMIFENSPTDTDDMKQKTFYVELPQLTDTNSYSTTTKSSSSIVWYGTKDKFNFFQTRENSYKHLDGIRIPTDFLKQNLLNVKLTSPHIFFTKYTESVEYPPAGMTGNTTTFSNLDYGNGTYTASSSSRDAPGGSMAFHAFDKQWNLYRFRTSFSNENAYNGSTGFYSGTASNSTVFSGSNYFGEHLTLQLPNAIAVKSYKYTSHGEAGNRCGNQWVFGGSTDGTNWQLLDTQSNVFWNDVNETKTFNLSNDTPYQYYRMLTTRVGNSNVSSFKNDWGIAELRLIGNEPVSLFSDYIMNITVKDTELSDE